MKKLNVKIKTYEYAGNYRVQVIDKDDQYEAWLYHKDYGVMDMMFGWPKVQHINGSDEPWSLKDFLGLVEGNIDSYIELYREEYEDC